MLEILPVLLLNKFLYTSGPQSSYHFISVIASCASLYFEKQTIACFFLSCLFFFYFVAFYSFIFLYYSLQFLCADVFFKCNKNIEFTFRIFYFVSFCTTGVACSFILYSYLIGFFSINFFSLCFYWTSIWTNLLLLLLSILNLLYRLISVTALCASISVL